MSQAPHDPTPRDGHVPPVPPPPNPYGGPPAPGYAPAYGYVAPRPTGPGSVAYVEQHFGQVAGFGQRVLALLVDSLISLLSLFPVLLGIALLVAGAPTQLGGYRANGYPVMSDSDPALLTVGFLLVGAGFLLGLAINLWNRVYRMGRTGQSVGKSVVGLRLVHAHTGQPIGPGPCFARELMSLLVNQAFYLSYLWMLWDENRQTLADKVVTSTVVVVPRA